MERLIAFITVFLFYNCSGDEISIVHYGLLTESNSSMMVQVETSHYNTFEDLLERIDQIVCKDSIPTISIKGNKEEKLLGLANYCSAWVVCAKRRNILKLKDDKIMMREPISIDSLKTYVIKHLENNGVSPFLSESPHKAIISISYEQNDMSNLTMILDKVISYHSSLTLKLPLVVTFDREIPPPEID